jgi:Mg-chelatase subunit ChlD
MRSIRVYRLAFILGIVILSMQIGTAPVRIASATSETEAIVQSERPAVEVLFVLDTTGSMGGLIAAAKEKIWSIANTLASADPPPHIRMGLVGYRDRGDVYVTQFSDLNEDLDGIYAQLMQFQAQGGGDGPESVNQALHEAVTRARWSGNRQTYRVIFLVGDAPPHMDYQDDVKYMQSCRLAKEKGIIINTIQCGQIPATTNYFREIAQLAGGEYFAVAQAGSAVMVETPYDAKISKLSQELDSTRVYYGTAAEQKKMAARQMQSDEIYASAKVSAVAKRALFNTKKAGAKNFLGSNELVNDVASGRVKLEEVEKEQLPATMQAMSPEELKKEIEARTKKRTQLTAQIADLGKKRQRFIEEKVRQSDLKGARSLDAKIFRCIQTQAKAKEIIYEGGPEY